jgi:hypothetical protein
MSQNVFSRLRFRKLDRWNKNGIKKSRGKEGHILNERHKWRQTSSSYSTTNLGQSGLFRSQHSRRPVISSVVAQVVVFLLDDILKVVHGICSVPFDEHSGTNFFSTYTVSSKDVTCSSKISSLISWLRRVYPPVHRKYLRSEAHFCCRRGTTEQKADSYNKLRYSDKGNGK